MLNDAIPTQRKPQNTTHAIPTARQESIAQGRTSSLSAMGASVFSPTTGLNRQGSLADLRGTSCWLQSMQGTRKWHANTSVLQHREGSSLGGSQLCCPMTTARPLAGFSTLQCPSHAQSMLSWADANEHSCGCCGLMLDLGSGDLGTDPTCPHLVPFTGLTGAALRTRLRMSCSSASVTAVRDGGLSSSHLEALRSQRVAPVVLLPIALVRAQGRSGPAVRGGVGRYGVSAAPNQLGPGAAVNPTGTIARLRHQSVASSWRVCHGHHLHRPYATSIGPGCFDWRAMFALISSGARGTTAPDPPRMARPERCREAQSATGSNTKGAWFARYW
jgi:hypothetical protein